MTGQGQLFLEIWVVLNGFSNGTILRMGGVAQFATEGTAPVLVFLGGRDRGTAVIRIVIGFGLTFGVKTGSLTSSSLGISGDINGFELFQKLVGLIQSSWIGIFVALEMLVAFANQP